MKGIITGQIYEKCAVPWVLYVLLLHMTVDARNNSLKLSEQGNQCLHTEFLIDSRV